VLFFSKNTSIRKYTRESPNNVTVVESVPYACLVVLFITYEFGVNAFRDTCRFAAVDFVLGGHLQLTRHYVRSGFTSGAP